MEQFSHGLQPESVRLTMRTLTDLDNAKIVEHLKALGESTMTTRTVYEIARIFIQDYPEQVDAQEYDMYRTEFAQKVYSHIPHEIQQITDEQKVINVSEKIFEELTEVKE